MVSTEVPAEQGRRSPARRATCSRWCENMPGVARAAAGSGQLVVWGAAPQDTRVYVDGVRVPRLYHDGGYRSVMHSDLVRSVELIPGAYGPNHGRGLGGIIGVQLRPLDEDGFHGSVDLNGIDAAVSTRVRLTENLSLAVGGRRSHLDQVVAAVSPLLPRKMSRTSCPSRASRTGRRGSSPALADGDGGTRRPRLVGRDRPHAAQLGPGAHHASEQRPCLSAAVRALREEGRRRVGLLGGGLGGRGPVRRSRTDTDERRRSSTGTRRSTA